jgi:hypothetical protein
MMASRMAHPYALPPRGKSPTQLNVLAFRPECLENDQASGGVFELMADCEHEKCHS